LYTFSLGGRTMAKANKLASPKAALKPKGGVEKSAKKAVQAAVKQETKKKVRSALAACTYSCNRPCSQRLIPPAGACGRAREQL
jgi:hypothetical protein